MQQKTYARRLITAYGVFFAYAALFLFNYLPPVAWTLNGWLSFTGRLWSVSHICIMGVAVFYLFKYRRLNRRDLALSGVAVLLSILARALNRGGLDAWAVFESLSMGLVFYAACRLYDVTGSHENTRACGIAEGFRNFALGAAIGIPFAALNVVFFALKSPMRIGRFFESAAGAVFPAIYEEIIYRFFLMAFGCKLLEGRASQRTFTVYIYIMMVVPHSLNHLPDLFLQSPSMALFLFAATSLLFGLPMAWLMRKRNLQAAMGFHWFIDFLRFYCGF